MHCRHKGFDTDKLIETADTDCSVVHNQLKWGGGSRERDEKGGHVVCREDAEAGTRDEGDADEVTRATI